VRGGGVRVMAQILVAASAHGKMAIGKLHRVRA
jgi:hypothetical protein